MKTEMKDDGVQKKEESTASFIIFTRARKRLRKRLRIRKKIVRIVKSIVLRKGAQTQMVRSRQAGTKNTGKTDFTHGKRGVQ